MTFAFGCFFQGKISVSRVSLNVLAFFFTHLLGLIGSGAGFHGVVCGHVVAGAEGVGGALVLVLVRVGSLVRAGRGGLEGLGVLGPAGKAIAGSLLGCLHGVSIRS